MRRLLTTLVAAAVVVMPLPPAAGAAGAVPDCSLMAATPPGTPLVVWCAASVASPTTGRHDSVRLWRSSGNGRWVEAKAANLVVNTPPAPPQVSPRWRNDRTLYWAMSGGLFASTDLGETFTPVAPTITAQQHPVRRVHLTDTGTAVRAAVAGYDPHDVGYATSAAATVVAPGSPDDDLVYVEGPSGTAVLAWDAATTAAHRVTAYRCTELLVCGEQWFTLPAPDGGGAQHLVGAWRRPGAAAGEGTYLATQAGDGTGRVSLWRAAAAGATPLPKADAVVSAVADGRNAPSVTVAFAGPRLLLRVVSWADARAAAHDKIAVSTDGGGSWRVAAAARTDAAGRSTGPRGWRPGAVSLSYVPALVVHDNLWLANVSDGSRYTFLCSRDGGRRWNTSCT